MECYFDIVQMTYTKASNPSFLQKNWDQLWTKSSKLFKDSHNTRFPQLDLNQIWGGGLVFCPHLGDSYKLFWFSFCINKKPPHYGTFRLDCHKGRGNPSRHPTSLYMNNECFNI